MNRRLAALGAAAVGIAALAYACRPIPAPADGVLSVSEVLLPSPAVVVGDTMRDSLGNVAPLRMYAFGVGGQTDTITENVAPTFILLDPGAHLDSNGYLIGDSARQAPVRIIGSIGSLQTPVANVDVTLRPDSMVQTSTAAIDTMRPSLFDSTSAHNLSPALGVTVLTNDTTPPGGVKDVIVRYTLLHAPSAAGGAVSTLLVNSARHSTDVDTTDLNGAASRYLFVRSQVDTAVDSIVVSASAEYAGVPLAGSPITFVIPVHAGAAATDRAR